jgi:CRISPR-associated RAMP protein (TIGR02581 family)
MIEPRIRDLSAITARLVMRGELRCLSGLRIGAAKDASGIGSDLPVLRDANQLPYVPGSSLKGVVRSAVEGLIRGAFPLNGSWSAKDQPPKIWACNPLGDGDSSGQNTSRQADEACLSRRWSKVLREERKQDDHTDLPLELVLAQSCTACSLFGNSELGGRVLFSDLPLLNASDLLSPVEIRDGVAIDRDMLTAVEKAKYDYEVVPAGARFALEIILDNPEPVLQGLLVAGLNALHEGHVRLGGFGSRGLGRVEVHVAEVRIRSAKEMLTGASGRTLSHDELRTEGGKALAAELGVSHA